jgi:hypothetical protein
VNDGVPQVFPALALGEPRLHPCCAVNGFHHEGLVGRIRCDYFDACAFGRLGVDAALDGTGGGQQPDELAGVEASHLRHRLIEHVQHWYAQMRLHPIHEGMRRVARNGDQVGFGRLQLLAGGEHGNGRVRPAAH